MRELCLFWTYNCVFPGTTQARLFRDSYAPITGASLAVYGLSTDSPKANTTFATKQTLPYPLLVRSSWLSLHCAVFPTPHLFLLLIVD